MNKRGGATDIQMGNFVKIIINIIIVLALIFFIGLIVYSLLNQEKCDNKGEWSAVEKTLKEIDKSGIPLQIPFRNTECKLVAFTSSQGYPYQLDNKFLSNKPMICLCAINENKCTPVDQCYNFENLKSISTIDGKVLNTENYDKNLIFLKFKKQDSNLIIEVIGPEVKYQEYSFDVNDEYIKKILLNSSLDLSSTSLTLVPLDRYSMTLSPKLGQQYKAYKLSLDPTMNPDVIKNLKLELTFDSQWNIEPMQRDSIKGASDDAFSHGTTHFKYKNKEITAEKEINKELNTENQIFYEVKVDEKGIPDEIVLLSQ